MKYIIFQLHTLKFVFSHMLLLRENFWLMILVAKSFDNHNDNKNKFFKKKIVIKNVLTTQRQI